MKYRIPVIFLSVVALFLVGVNLINQLVTPQVDDGGIKISTTVGSIQQPKTPETFMAPVLQDVPIVRYYYEEGSQTNEQALDYFEGVYRQSQGIDYGRENSFEVIASLSGVVSEVKKDAVLGSCVTIDCESGIQLIYQSLSNVRLTEGESIAQGSLIGESGNNIYESDLGNHVHFTVLKDDRLLNPLDLINKQVSEIE